MKVKGRDGSFSVEGVVYGETEEYTIETTANTEEGMTLGEEWADPECLTKAWNGTATLFYDPEDPAIGSYYEGMEGDVIFYPRGNTSGNEQLTGRIIVTATSHSVAVSSLQKISVTFEGKGELVRGTIA